MSSIDVIVPVFNAATYLAEAIDSVLAQTHRVARVIVVDDGSTDDSAAIAEAFGPPVEVIRLDGNHGAARARNAGLAASDAPLVAFLDADDRWLPDKLAAQCAALDAATGPGADDEADDVAADDVSSRVANAVGNGVANAAAGTDTGCAPSASVGAAVAPMFALCRLRMFASPELPPPEQALLVAQHTAEAEGWLISALVVRRELFSRVGGFAEDLRIGEVIDWFSRARVHPFVHVDAVGVERRLHRSNTTRRAQADPRGYLLAARRHLARQRAQGTP